MAAYRFTNVAIAVFVSDGGETSFVWCIYGDVGATPDMARVAEPALRCVDPVLMTFELLVSTGHRMPVLIAQPARPTCKVGARIGSARSSWLVRHST